MKKTLLLTYIIGFNLACINLIYPQKSYLKRPIKFLKIHKKKIIAGSIVAGVGILGYLYREEIKKLLSDVKPLGSNNPVPSNPPGKMTVNDTPSHPKNDSQSNQKVEKVEKVEGDAPLVDDKGKKENPSAQTKQVLTTENRTAKGNFKSRVTDIILNLLAKQALTTENRTAKGNFKSKVADIILNLLGVNILYESNNISVAQEYRTSDTKTGVEVKSAVQNGKLMVWSINYVPSNQATSNSTAKSYIYTAHNTGEKYVYSPALGKSIPLIELGSKSAQSKFIKNPSSH
jgi:hypothetical protein